ncbi:11S globulin seed storage protein Jug r 4 [Andrographis paniculata]|uniref:11S globulin seed storage protein Jug r 4 n=1 Tax=Andrographis paniculata TaxID=175694 RepID=UPI0021E8C93C|nr:11S globulin seed storage protein Jug r 4 [Andrographis paniculata]
MTKLCCFPVLTLLFLLSFTSAIREREQGRWQEGSCQLSSIDAREPSYSLQAEGGVTEFWDYNNGESQCAGVSIRRHRIQPRGLLLPLFHNAPVVFYAVQGRGLYGVLISGCPETFEYSQEEEGERGRSQRFRDRHQKIEQFREGDFVAVPQGAAHWIYNDGDQELVLVVFHHNSNDANQLDQNPRSFLLAGNTENAQQRPQYRREKSAHGQQEFGNIFRGFDLEILAEAFEVGQKTASKLQSEDDSRGHIVLAEKNLKVIRPTYRQEEEERRRGNGLDETICTAKIKENLDKPSRADVYNPRAGRFSTFNSQTLPILNLIRLSAARGVLYKNGIMAPHWYVNAHSTIYATRGDARMQIVNHRGQAVFEGQIREGEVVVVPQNFAVVKKAGENGFEWVELNTNENAMINTLSGRTSAIRALPVDVIANAYQLPREEAARLKLQRQETLIFSGSGERSERGERGRVASA